MSFLVGGVYAEILWRGLQNQCEFVRGLWNQKDLETPL